MEFRQYFHPLSGWSLTSKHIIQELLSDGNSEGENNQCFLLSWNDDISDAPLELSDDLTFMMMLTKFEVNSK